MKRPDRTAACLGLMAALALALPGCNESVPIGKVARSHGAIVSTSNPLATAAGRDILALGGNAADAAVAAAFVLTVVEPSMSGIAGHSQILLRNVAGEIFAIDGANQGPAGYAPRGLSSCFGPDTAGIPGTLAALMKLHGEHGGLPLPFVMAPSIRLAREGFALSRGESLRHEAVHASLPLGSPFLDPQGNTHAAGAVLAQPSLSDVLRQISRDAGESFYRGEIAEQIVAHLAGVGSPITLEDLAAYEALDAGVVVGEYRGVTLITPAFPASGASVIEALQILSHFDIAGLSPEERVLVTSDAIATALRDRRFDGGLEDEADSERIASGEWAAERAATIALPTLAAFEGNTRMASPSLLGSLWARLHDWRGDLPVGPGSPQRLAALRTGRCAGMPLGKHTTHLVTADASGTVVSLTQSLGPVMGTRMTTPGLGFLYSPTLGPAGADNLHALLPGGRALSSHSPMILMREGRPVAALGAAGGEHIISTLVQVISRWADDGAPLEEAITAPRFYPNSVDGAIVFETTSDGWSPEFVQHFADAGIAVSSDERSGSFGTVHAIEADGPRRWTGIADPDWEGSAAGASWIWLPPDDPESGGRDGRSNR